MVGHFRHILLVDSRRDHFRSPALIPTSSVDPVSQLWKQWLLPHDVEPAEPLLIRMGIVTGNTPQNHPKIQPELVVAELWELCYTTCVVRERKKTYHQSSDCRSVRARIERWEEPLQTVNFLPISDCVPKSNE